jgi:uncharacterized protein (TIGR00661 family)
MPNTNLSKRILVAPLDWGLGHATRCIPIINELLKRNCEVMIASSGSALVLLKKEFPELRFFELPSYKASYPSWLPFMVGISIQMPKFLLAINKEHKQLNRIVSEEKIDLVIADSRYGCWSDKVKTIFITHQLTILMPHGLKWLESFINWGNHRQIGKFDQCWVPDFPDERITGALTNSVKLKVKYIGMLSRFTRLQQSKKYDVVAILSGPEPQRTLFEEIIRKQFSDLKKTKLIVRGLPHQPELKNESNDEINHLTSVDLMNIISQSEIIISRSGYTSVMDYAAMGSKVIFVPTPGQTEQEYLAVELEKKKVAFFQTQNQFDTNEALAQSKMYTGFAGWKLEPNLLTKAIDEVLG